MRLKLQKSYLSRSPTSHIFPIQKSPSHLHRSQAQLHSQLAQLSANLADTENLLRMTSVQAEAMRGLGSWHAGLSVTTFTLSVAVDVCFADLRNRFMASSKVLGEESIQNQNQQGSGQS
jgi:hypothetical protein